MAAKSIGLRGDPPTATTGKRATQIFARHGEPQRLWSADQADFDQLRLVAYRAALKILRFDQDAQDVAQAAMVALVTRPTLPDNSAAWVTTVAQRVALNELRRRHNAARKRDQLEQTLSQSSEDFAERVVGRLLLDELLDALPLRQREALELRFLADLAQADVAEVMGIAVATVKTHLERGMAAARALYEEGRGS